MTDNDESDDENVDQPDISSVAVDKDSTHVPSTVISKKQSVYTINEIDKVKKNKSLIIIMCFFFSFAFLDCSYVTTDFLLTRLSELFAFCSP